MATSLYLSGEYLTTHPTWHVEDSAWKAEHVYRMIHRHGLKIRTLSEIGCGAGEILAQLQRRIGASCSFTGYEFSPHALAMCGQRENKGLQFSSGDGLAEDKPIVDLAVALDVLEHVDNYPEFVRRMRQRARYCIFHIPLDLSLLSLVTGMPQRVRKSAGHLHYFTRALALAAVEESGLSIVEARYTRPAIERPNKTWTGRLARLPRLALASVHEDFAALALGGFSLLVLAQNKEAA